MSPPPLRPPTRTPYPPEGGRPLRLGTASVWMLPSRALWIPDARALLVADLHIGKDATFRRAGIAIPHGTLEDDLARLDRILADTAAGALWVLGDLFHAREGLSPHTLDTLAAWRALHPDLEIHLVRGNHDTHAGDPPGSLDIECHNPGAATIDDLALLHDPAHAPPAPVSSLAGHIHPMLTLRERRGPALRVPVFFLRAGTLILPAFSVFTGGAPIDPAPGDRVFAIVEDQVIEVPSALR